MAPVRAFVDDRGFTLVELLVCILIVGIMAAIALPAFFNQRAKGEDTEAKLTLKSAATALVTYEMNAGTYDATVAELEVIEPALGEARNLSVDGDAVSWELTEDSASGTIFTLTRDAAGRVTRDCSIPGQGLCRAALDAGGNRW
jgi:type IV pilus assembly protein PilA